MLFESSIRKTHVASNLDLLHETLFHYYVSELLPLVLFLIRIYQHMKIVELLLFTVDVGNENPHRILDVLDGSEVGCCF